MLDSFEVECADCQSIHRMDTWKNVRTMVEGVNGRSSYRYVYHSQKRCTCGLDLLVEAQGYRAPEEEIVSKWYYRFFECAELRRIEHVDYC